MRLLSRSTKFGATATHPRTHTQHNHQYMRTPLSSALDVHARFMLGVALRLSRASSGVLCSLKSAGLIIAFGSPLHTARIKSEERAQAAGAVMFGCESVRCGSSFVPFERGD
jgi:hypothetical protein